jgi:hypothetical protein
MRIAPVVLVVIGGLAAANGVRADQVHLVGGAQLDGKATRHGDKIVVELESGQITLSADSVERIDRGQSTVQRFQELESKLKPGDVQARLALADFCRDHDMRSREQDLLQQVIDLDKDQPQARARLGFVRAGSGWITRDEQQRASGMVRRDGQWVTPERAMELDRLNAQSEQAARDRERAQAELETRKLELQTKKLELENERARAAQAATTPANNYGYGYGYGYGGYAPSYRRDRNGVAPTSPNNGFSRGPTFPINGVRDPRDNTWSLPGVRNPRSY